MSSPCRIGRGTTRTLGALVDGVLVLASAQLAGSLCLLTCRLACGRDFTREEGGDTAACGVSNLTPRELAQVVAIGVFAAEVRRLAPGRWLVAPLSVLVAGTAAWVVGAQLDLSALEPSTGLAPEIVGLASMLCALMLWAWVALRSRPRRAGARRAAPLPLWRSIEALVVESLVAAATAGVLAGLPDSFWWWLEAACDPVLPPALRCGDLESAFRSAGVAFSLGVGQTVRSLRRTALIPSPRRHT